MAYITISDSEDEETSISNSVKTVMLNGALLGMLLAFYNIFVQTCENIPTVVRPIFLGSLFFFGNISAIGSIYFFNFLSDFQQEPLIFYSAIIGTAGLFSCTIPDTSEWILRDFLEEQKQELTKQQDLSIIQKKEVSKILGLS